MHHHILALERRPNGLEVGQIRARGRLCPLRAPVQCREPRLRFQALASKAADQPAHAGNEDVHCAVAMARAGEVSRRSSINACATSRARTAAKAHPKLFAELLDIVDAGGNGSAHLGLSDGLADTYEHNEANINAMHSYLQLCCEALRVSERMISSLDQGRNCNERGFRRAGWRPAARPSPPTRR